MNNVTASFKKKSISSQIITEFPNYEDYLFFLRLLKKGCKFYNSKEVFVEVSVDIKYFKRRIGLEFVLRDFKFFFVLLKEKHINTFEFLINIAIHLIKNIFLPSLFYEFFYRFFLRR